MKKALVVGLIFGRLLFGNSCTLSEEQRAEEIFNRSLNQDSFEKKIALIIEAKNICAIDLADVELQYMKIENDFAKGDLEDIKERLQNLSSANDSLDNKYFNYKLMLRTL
jgi:uncharacterized membrane protein YvbJ